MKLMKNSIWAKLVALLLAVISGGLLIVSAGATIMFGVVPETQLTQKDMEEAVQKRLLEGYGNYLVRDSGVLNEQGGSAAGSWDGLTGGNIDYTVYKCDTQDEIPQMLYTTDSPIDERTAMASVRVPESGYTGYIVQETSMMALLTSYAQQSWYVMDHWRVRHVNGIVYDEEDGLLYAQGTTGNYYRMTEFFREADDTDSDREMVMTHYGLVEDGRSIYYMSDDDEKVDDTVVKNWMTQPATFYFDNYAASFDSGYADVKIETVENIPEDKKLQLDEYELDSNGSINYNAMTLRGKQIYDYVVCLSLKDASVSTTTLKCGIRDYTNSVATLTSATCTFRKTSGIWVVLFAVIWLVSFVYLMRAAGRRTDGKIHLSWVDRIPYAVFLFAVGMLMTGCAAMVVWSTQAFYEMRSTFSLSMAGIIVFLSVAQLLALLVLMSSAVRVKTHNFWKYTLCHQLCRPFQWIASMLREHTSLVLRAGAVLIALTLVELIVIAATGYDTGVEVALFFLYKLVEIPFVYKVLFQMKKILDGGRRMVNGDYSRPIDTRHMRGAFREHADHMNNLGQGISRAVDEQMKSERFKTELITNVSHDIKTPLTSIINYVDLLEKEKIDNPQVQEYLEVLDRQSARLKKLIEDLMEASKASTGNLKVELERCDATVMLTQIVGEFEDRAKKNELDIVVSSPEPPANIMADGRHLWRVIDNLMSNICKYAQPGTRVYIDLEKFNGMVIMTFRNTSRYQLNISSDELMERFVRGDSSRNTEGSGLGLSIAQSLTALMGGNFAIQIDGDLFKAILSFEECR